MKIPNKEQLPFPLSALFRKIQQEEQYNGCPSIFSLLEVSFATSRFVAFVALAEYFQIEMAQRSIGKHNRYIFSSLQKPGDGTWIALLEYLIKHMQIEKNYTKTISNALQSSCGANTVLQILKNHVVIRNQFIHRNEYINEGNILLQLKSEIENLTSLWQLLCSYSVCYNTTDNKTIALKGTAPFTSIDAQTEQQEMWVTSSDGILSLSPWLYFDETAQEVYFYAKAQARRLFFMNYLQGGQVNAEKLNISLYSKCHQKLSELEKNSAPVERVQKEIALDFGYLCDFHSSNFVGREDIINSISEFLASASGAYGIMVGEAGIGKTALFASIYENNRQKSLENQYLWHFCAQTDERDNPQVFFRSLLAQGYKKFPDLAKEIPFEIKALAFQWQQFLQQVSEKGYQLVFIVDALDESLQFHNPQESIAHLLPKKLPQNISAIISIREDMLSALPMHTFQNTVSLPKLQKLSEKNVYKLLVDKIGIAENVITPEIMEKIWKNSQNGDPFYLRFMADALRSGSLSLQNINLIPDSLESFFEETWLTVPTDDDFLAHKILGLLAIMEETGEDSKFADILGKSENQITRIRVQLNKLLVMKQESYTIFHQKFRSYILQKFAPRDMAHFHDSLCKYYDNKNEQGQRQITFFSEEALRHIYYHAYQKGLHDKDFAYLYELIADDNLRTQKKEQLKSTQFVLDDIQYALKALSQEAFADEEKLVLLYQNAWLFNSIINKGRKSTPQAIASYVDAKKYDLALAEIQLLSDEKQQFYQLVILAIAAMIHQQQDNVNTILALLESLPTPELAQENIPIYIIFAIECIHYGYSEFYKLLPKNTEISFWQPILNKANKQGKAIEITEYLQQQDDSNEEWLHSLIVSLSLSLVPDSPWCQFIYKNIKSPSLLANLLLQNQPTQELIEDVVLLIPDTNNTKEKAEIITLLLQQNVQDISVLEKIIYYIGEIDDEAVKVQLATQFLHSNKNIDTKTIEVMDDILQGCTSIQKRFSLEVALLICKSNNLDELWLTLDSKVKEIETSGDTKEIRKMIDIAKSLILIEGDAAKDVKEDLAKTITSQMYSIYDESLRNEVMLEITKAFSAASINKTAEELCEQLIYTTKSIFPWKNRCHYLVAITDIVLTLKQESLITTLHHVCNEYPKHLQSKLYTDVIEELPSQQQLNLFIEMFWTDKSPAQLEKIFCVCNNLEKYERNETTRLSTLLLTIAHPVLRAQSLFRLAQHVHYFGEKQQTIEYLLKGQQLQIEQQKNYLIPRVLYTTAKINQKEQDICVYLQQNQSENTSWESDLFIAKLETDHEKVKTQLEKSLNNIFADGDVWRKWYSLRIWIEELSLTEITTSKQCLLQIKDWVVDASDAYQKLSILETLASKLRHVEKTKDAKQLLDYLIQLAEESFVDDPVYLARSITKILQSVQHNSQFKEELEKNLDKVWHLVETNKQNHFHLAAILRSLRPYGHTKKIKDYFDPVMNNIEGEKDHVTKTRILLDTLRTLTGIETISRLQRIVGKLLQAISQIPHPRERRNRLVELAGMFSRLEQYSNMDSVWEYLARVETMVDEIENPYLRCTAQIDIAQKIHKYKGEKADKILIKVNNDIHLIENIYQKSHTSAKLASLYAEKQEFSNYLGAIEAIPVNDIQMSSVLDTFPKLPYNWQLKTLVFAVQDDKTLDQLFTIMLRKQNYNSATVQSMQDLVKLH